MGAGASLPAKCDKKLCQDLAGARFNEALWERMADSDGTVSQQTLLRMSRMTDTFLTHDWGTFTGRNGETVNNHERVSQVNTALKKLGFATWFDEEKMTGNVVDQMCKGIDDSQTAVNELFHCLQEVFFASFPTILINIMFISSVCSLRRGTSIRSEATTKVTIASWSLAMQHEPRPQK